MKLTRRRILLITAIGIIAVLVSWGSLQTLIGPEQVFSIVPGDDPTMKVNLSDGYCQRFLTYATSQFKQAVSYRLTLVSLWLSASQPIGEISSFSLTIHGDAVLSGSYDTGAVSVSIGQERQKVDIGVDTKIEFPIGFDRGKFVYFCPTALSEGISWHLSFVARDETFIRQSTLTNRDGVPVIVESGKNLSPGNQATMSAWGERSDFFYLSVQASVDGPVVKIFGSMLNTVPPVSGTVSWGDGKTDAVSANAEGSTFSATHKYDAGGVFDITTTMTDSARVTQTHVTSGVKVSSELTADYTHTVLSSHGDTKYVGTASGGIPPYRFAWNFPHAGVGKEGQEVVQVEPCGVSITVILDVSDSSAPTQVVRVSKTFTVVCQSMALDVGGIFVFPLGSLVGFSVPVSGGDGNYQYVWTFGDGTTSHESSPWHVYWKSGQYGITASACDGSNNCGATTTTIYAIGAPVMALAAAGVASTVVGIFVFKNRLLKYGGISLVAVAVLLVMAGVV